jgi:hypothetical protein
VKFTMITTFFGGHSFGGDAAYVDRLCQALCRRGHEVHVYHCVDAFNAVRGSHPLREYTPTQGLHLHPLESGLGILSPLATQATGLPLFKAAALREARGFRPVYRPHRVDKGVADAPSNLANFRGKKT